MQIGIKSGVFTLLTAAHIKAFEFAKKHCDYLIVINNDDNYVRRKKGVVPLVASERKIILESIRYIDEVCTYSGNNEQNWLENFKKKKLKQVFGKDAKLIVFHAHYIENSNLIPGKNIADKIIYIPHYYLFSSVSDIFSKIRDKNEDRI